MGFNKIQFDKSGFNKNILYNKYLLYFIFFISFGNFFMELMKGDMYFVAIYILIGFLTSFFNKNMIIILSLSVIFANILKYGRASTYEGFDHDDDDDDDTEKDGEKTDIDKALSSDTSKDGEVIDKILGEDSKEKTNKKSDKKNEKLKEFTGDQELLESNFKKAEKLIDKQNDLLDKLNEYKPFLSTIQGIVKNTGLAKNE